MNLGLLGAGGIAHEVARALNDDRVKGTRIVGLVTREPVSERAEALSTKSGAPILRFDELLSARPDCILEAAGAGAVHEFGPTILRAGIDFIVMSIGALLDDALREELQASNNEGRLILPSGAVAGLDGVRALAASESLTLARITTIKSPRSLVGADYLVEHGIDLPSDKAVTVFEGTARDAVRGFPRNINVSAALSLAGIGPDKTIVKIVSDPTVTRSRHDISVEGSVGRIHVTVESNPLADNPRTSALAAMSALRAVADVAAQRTPLRTSMG